MGNKRIVVFDADKGTYKRQWAGSGSPFSDVTCVEIARDGMVYVCDKSNNRIQVFDKSGKFVKEGYVAKSTGGGIIAGSFGVLNAKGSVWDVALSNDPQQRWLFVADGMNKKVRVLNRDTLDRGRRDRQRRPVSGPVPRRQQRRHRCAGQPVHGRNASRQARAEVHAGQVGAARRGRSPGPAHAAALRWTVDWTGDKV